MTEARNDGFVATLTDKTNPSNPDEQVVFDIGEVSEEDRGFTTVGSSFYWTIGSERMPSGQLKNVSMLQFRRLPAWTRSSVARAEARARNIGQLFRSGE